MFNKEKPKKGRILLIIIAIILVGFVAGIAGEFFTRYYLSQFSFFRDISLLSSNINGQGIVISQPKKVVVEQEMQVDQVVSDAGPSIIGIYRNKKISGSNIIDKIFTQNDLLSLGFVLTSDGWIVAPQEALSGLKKTDIIVIYNHKNYNAVEMIIDEAIKTAFIKIDSQNLPVVAMAKREELTAGQNVILYNSVNGQIELSAINKLDYRPLLSRSDYVQSSESYDGRILLNDEMDKSFLGVPAINLSGQIIGLSVDKDNRSVVLPINYIKATMETVLSEKVARHFYIGINFINLTDAIGLDESYYQNTNNGIIINSVMANSPLAKDLKSGDIITSVENQNISDQLSFTDLILQYRLGQQITLKYRSDGQDKEAALTLENLK